MSGKKKILIITPEAPYPLYSGADIAQHYFLEKLPNYFDIYYCVPIYDDRHYYKLNHYKKKNTEVNYKELDLRPFKLSILNAKIKMRSLLDKILQIRRTVDEKNYNPYSKYVNPKLVDHINGVIVEENIDIVQIEFLQMANLPQFIRGNVLKIFIHHEIWFKAVAKRNKIFNFFTETQISELENEEISLLSNFDRIAVFNNDDKQLLEGLLPSKKICLSPYGIPNELIYKTVPESYKNFLFIGSEMHIANKEGLSWFLDVICIPNITNIKEEIIIIGKWSKAFQEKYKRFDQIKFLGYVEKIEDYYVGSIMIAPILSGSGLRTKILLALANSVPVMATTFAAEGLINDKEKENNHILLFNNEAEFLSLNEKINQDFSFIANIGENGNIYFNQYFSNKKLLEMRMQLYD